MSRMVTVLVLPPGSTPIRTEKIDGDDSNELVRLVGGTLGTCPLPRSWRSAMYYAFCDDEAMIRPDQPEPNRWAHHLGHDVLRGPIVIVKTDHEGETRTLNRAALADLEMRLHMEPSQEALESARREHQFWTDHPSGFVIQTLNPATGQWE
jgi:hypothetical protein